MPSVDELDALNAQALAALTPAPAGPAAPQQAPTLDELDALNVQALSGATEAPAIEAPSAPAVDEEPRQEVYNPQGQLVTLPASLLSEAIQNGYETPAQRQQKAEAAEYGDLGSTIAGGAEAVAQGATMGLYGLAADKLAGDDYTRERQLREKYNPGTALAGNLFGAAAPALFSGGAGIAGTVARMTPAGKLASLGTRLGEALTAKAASAGGRIGALAAAGALEGAVDNATRQVAEDLTAGDVDITAERILASAGEGMLFGGGVGGGVGAIAEGAGYVGRLFRSADDVAPTAAPDMPAPTQAVEVPRQPARAVADIDAELDRAREALVESDVVGDVARADSIQDDIVRLSTEKEAAAARESGLSTPESIDELSRARPDEPLQASVDFERAVDKAQAAKDLDNAFTSEVDRQLRTAGDALDEIKRIDQTRVEPYVNRSNKSKVIRAQLEDEGVVWSTKQADEVLRNLGDMKKIIAETVEDKLLSKVDRGVFRSQLELIDNALEKATGIRGAGPISPESRILRGELDDIAALYDLQDQLKSLMGPAARNQVQGFTGKRQATLQRAYMRMRSHLTDQRTYGAKLTEFQTLHNAAISRMLDLDDAFRSKFAASFSREKAGQHGFDQLIEVDPGKVRGFWERLSNAESYKDEQIFLGYLKASQDLKEVEARYFPMPDQAMEAINMRRQLIDQEVVRARALKDLDVRRKVAKAEASKTADLGLLKQAILYGVNHLGGAIGATVGGAIGGLPGALAGGVIGEAARKILSARVLAMGETAVKTEGKIASASKRTVRGVMESTGQVARKARAAVKSAGVGGTVMTANAIARAVEQAMELQDPESPRSQQLGASLQEVAQESPELAEVIKQKTLSQAAFIAEKVGPQVDDSDPFAPGRPVPMDRIKARKVARYVDAAKNPMGALERLADGRGTVEDRETLQVLYPRLYQRFVDGVVAELGKVKKPPSRKVRQQLYFATGVPMAREQQPDSLAFFQSLSAGAPDAPEASSPGTAPAVSPGKAKFSTDRDKRMASRADAIMGEHDDA